MSPLAGRVALVTGASRGIGLAAAAALGQAGARVVRVSRTLPASRSATRLDLPCDVTDPTAVAALVAEIDRTFGAPDVVVSNAGTFLLARFAETTPEDFAAQLASNLTAPFILARALLPAMRARGSGRLITIGSIADHRPLPGNAAYAAAKFGLRGLHQVLREELAGSGVLCTLLSPGATDTAMWDPVDPDSREGFTPRARMLRPADVADAVCWIATRPPGVDIDWMRIGPA